MFLYTELMIVFYMKNVHPAMTIMQKFIVPFHFKAKKKIDDVEEQDTVTSVS